MVKCLVLKFNIENSQQVSYGLIERKKKSKKTRNYPFRQII